MREVQAESERHGDATSSFEQVIASMRWVEGSRNCLSQPWLRSEVRPRGCTQDTEEPAKPLIDLLRSTSFAAHD